MIASFLIKNRLKITIFTILFITVIIPVISVIDSITTTTTHMFGGETKSEKITRLETNVKVLEDIKKTIDNNIVKKEKELNTTTTIKREIKVTTRKIEIKKDKIIHKLESKVNVIKNKQKKDIVKVNIVNNDKPKLVLQHIKKKKPKQIIKIEDKVRYEEVGNTLIDSMDEAYSLAMKG